MNTTGIGNYPPGVTDNDPEFDREFDKEEVEEGFECEGCGQMFELESDLSSDNLCVDCENEDDEDTDE